MPSGRPVHRERGEEAVGGGGPKEQARRVSSGWGVGSWMRPVLFPAGQSSRLFRKDGVLVAEAAWLGSDVGLSAEVLLYMYFTSETASQAGG